MASAVKQHIQTKHLTILAVAAIIYTAILFGLSWYKYSHFLYNALDLAIYNNVFYNTLQGNVLYSSIQGHSFLSDHFTPLLAALLPFYAIFAHPLTLLLLQTIVLASTGFVIYHLAKNLLPDASPHASPAIKHLTLFFALAWFVNPLVWNVNLFEFHILPLAVPLLLLTFFFYHKNNYKLFTLFAILSSAVREDIALIVIMFGIIAFFEKKPKKFIFTPVLWGAGYFALALHIMRGVSGATYRFSAYYAWLGDSPLLIAHNLIMKPSQLAAHILSLGNLDMIIGLLFPFLFLPLIKPKYLILALPPLAQFVMGRAGGSNIIIQTHYAALFLPALIIASLVALRHLTENPLHRLSRLASFDPLIPQITLPLFFLLTLTFFSPLASIAKTFSATHNNASPNETREILEKIPSRVPLISSYDALPYLSTRTELYSAHYVFLGTQQFSDKPYPLPYTPSAIVFDTKDLITWWLQLSNQGDAVKLYHQGIARFQNALTDFYPRLFPNGISVWIPTTAASTTPFPLPQQASSPTPVCAANMSQEYYLITCSVQEPEDNIVFLRVIDAHSTSRVIPFLWREYDKKSSSYQADAFFFLNQDTWQFPLRIQAIEIQGQIELGPWLNVENNIYQITPFSTDFVLLSGKGADAAN